MWIQGPLPTRQPLWGRAGTCLRRAAQERLCKVESELTALGTQVLHERQDPSEPWEWLRGLPSFSSGCGRAVPPSLSPSLRVPREPASCSADGCSCIQMVTCGSWPI